jgi:hypothetical protein
MNAPCSSTPFRSVPGTLRSPGPFPGWQAAHPTPPFGRLLILVNSVRANRLPREQLLRQLEAQQPQPPPATLVVVGGVRHLADSSDGGGAAAARAGGDVSGGAAAVAAPGRDGIGGSPERAIADGQPTQMDGRGRWHLKGPRTLFLEAPDPTSTHPIPFSRPAQPPTGTSQRHGLDICTTCNHANDPCHRFLTTAWIGPLS